MDVFFETWCRCTVLARIPDLIICRFRIALKMRLEYASSRLKELNYVASQTYECTAMPVCVYLTQFCCCCCCCCWWWWWWCQWLDVMLVIVIVYIELVVLLRCVVTLHQTYQYDQEIERLTWGCNYQYLYLYCSLVRKLHAATNAVCSHVNFASAMS